MKVYAVKRIDNKYLSKYSNYDYRLENSCEPCWTEKIYNAKIFEEYDEADNFCNTIDCQIVECSFMETTELADYTKQVREEVCEILDKKIYNYLSNKCRYAESLDVHSIIQQVMKENLEQIQDKGDKDE